MARVLDSDTVVLRHLLARWEVLFRLTTIEQAQRALELPADPAQRRRLGDHLLTHPEIHPAIARWGAPTFILTEGEKRLGRYLVQRSPSGPAASLLPSDWSVHAEARRDRDGDTMMPWVPLRRAMRCSSADLERGLATLSHLGLVTWERADGTLRYALAPHWEARLGPLAFTYHTVALADGERFNVPCAIDFLLLVSSEHTADQVVVDDSCAHCVEPIRVVLEQEMVVAAEPAEALVFRGGG